MQGGRNFDLTAGETQRFLFIQSSKTLILFLIMLIITFMDVHYTNFANEVTTVKADWREIGYFQGDTAREVG